MGLLGTASEGRIRAGEGDAGPRALACRPSLLVSASGLAWAEVAIGHRTPAGAKQFLGHDRQLLALGLALLGTVAMAFRGLPGLIYDWLTEGSINCLDLG